MNSSRRGFLRFGLALGAAKALRISGLASEASGAPLFLDVPRSSSGIEWVHENAMSPSRYLPEAVGPGCAFLDYDNDGWMDIFLVNSGPSDFWKPSRSEEHTSELQSRLHLVCRLLLEKKKNWSVQRALRYA